MLIRERTKIRAPLLERLPIPYLRGYGPTRFLSADTPRSGQQGAVGRDLLDLMDALGLQTAALVGFDWGGRAACVVAALWPERVRCLVLANGYSIQNIAASVEPRLPEQEHRAWYQFYFHTERGRAGLAQGPASRLASASRFPSMSSIASRRNSFATVVCRRQALRALEAVPAGVRPAGQPGNDARKGCGWARLFNGFLFQDSKGYAQNVCDEARRSPESLALRA